MEDLLKNKRALSRNQLIESGFAFSDYCNEYPNGIYIGTLDMKAWGKSPCLHCFFTIESGDKIILTVYAANNYSPSKSDFDMSDSDMRIGDKFELKINKTRPGRTVWEHVKKI